LIASSKARRLPTYRFSNQAWRLIPGRYDNGAFSGASLDRPALQQLLADIRGGKIDIVLVYKVDRLTRSLADFAKLTRVPNTLT
jgi:site-specific DNA recombinase